MSRRRRGKKNNLPILAFAIVVIAGFALFLLFSSGSIFEDDSICGEAREKDPDNGGYCMTTKNDHDELAIVVGNTQNSPEPNLDFTKGELLDILKGVFYNTERNDSPNIYIISASGTNKRIDYNDKYRVKRNVSASNNELKNLGKEINSAIKSLPTEPGADYIGGILEAGTILKDAENPLIIVVGSGYNDTGALNFAQNNILQNKDIAIDYLKRNNRIRENILDGKSVQWYDIGNVVSPQVDLSDYKTDIREIYDDVISYLGGKIQFDSSKEIKNESVKSQFTVQQVYIDKLKEGDIFNITENIGEFKPESSELKTPLAELKDKLTPFVSKFDLNAGIRLDVTGYTYVGSGNRCPTDGQIALGRANTIKGVLIDMGVPSNKIDTHGGKGAPADGPDYTCSSNLPASEQRTVKIKVLKD
ncbi:hypothetical protein IKE07_01260 [Candidatus Saccharibacteria bacterium]|nr:hypothetical protein [Candidatus Saccharibacteria bacterium]